jgi:hypothetical protein
LEAICANLATLPFQFDWYEEILGYLQKMMAEDTLLLLCVEEFLNIYTRPISE